MMYVYKNKFLAGCQEVETYLQLLEFVDKYDVLSSNKIKATSINGKRITCEINQDIQLISRATIYILIYNLIEATAHSMKESLEAILQNENVKFDELSDKMQQLYLKSIFVLKDDQTSVSAQSQTLIKDVIYQEKIDPKKINIHISGNVDLEYIEHLLTEIGCFGHTTNRTKYSYDAFKIMKDARNKLAHGNESFSVRGRQVEYQKLRRFYKRIHLCLEETINLFDAYIQHKKYLKNPI